MVRFSIQPIEKQPQKLVQRPAEGTQAIGEIELKGKIRLSLGHVIDRVWKDLPSGPAEAADGPWHMKGGGHQKPHFPFLWLHQTVAEGGVFRRVSRPRPERCHMI